MRVEIHGFFISSFIASSTNHFADIISSRVIAESGLFSSDQCSPESLSRITSKSVMRSQFMTLPNHGVFSNLLQAGQPDLWSDPGPAVIFLSEHLK